MTFSSRCKDYLELVKEDSSNSFLEELDFAVRRINFQGNDQDRHIYQSFRAVTPFLMFAGFSATSSLALGLTKIANLCPKWSLGTHFKFSIVTGMTYMLFHHYLLTPLEINHLLTSSNSSYTKLCHAVLDGRDDKDIWYNALNLNSFDKTVNRDYFAVVNFQHSGHSAVIAFDPATESSNNIPIDGIPLTEDDIFNDVTQVNKMYRDTRLDFCVDSKGNFDSYSANSLKSNISAYCELHAIPMPEYFKPFKGFHDAQAVLERPVDYLHVYRDDDKTVRGHLPPAFQSPQDILAVQKSRQSIQNEVNRQSREQFKQQQQNQ